jgi:hypothetical protein
VPGRLPGSRAALARVLRDARLVVSAGRYPAAEARRVVPDITASLVEVPPGVDIEWFRPGSRRPSAGRRATWLGLPADGPVGGPA